MSITRGHSVLPSRASAPASPEVGEAYFDTTLGQPRWWNGTTWFTPGAGAAGGYTHIQPSATTVWTINHGLGYEPSVTVIDSVHDQVWADVHHVDINNLTITFGLSLAGKAYLI